MTEGVKIAFERRVISVAVGRLLPARALPPGLHETVKYRRIAASVSEVGLIEPLSVARQKDGAICCWMGTPTRCLARPRGCRSALHHRQ
jgi:hypothetical protein